MRQPNQHILLVLSNLGYVSLLSIESVVDEGYNLTKNINFNFKFANTLFIFGIDLVLTLR